MKNQNDQFLTSSPSRSRVNKRNVFKHKFIEFELNERKRVINCVTSRCFLSKSSSGNAKLFAFYIEENKN